MAKRTVRYAPEFKRQMVDLLRSGRTAASLAKEFPPSAWTIALWAKQDARDGGKGDGGLTSAEREELRTRPEIRVLLPSPPQSRLLKNTSADVGDV